MRRRRWCGVVAAAEGSSAPRLSKYSGQRQVRRLQLQWSSPGFPPLSLHLPSSSPPTPSALLPPPSLASPPPLLLPFFPPPPLLLSRSLSLHLFPFFPDSLPWALLLSFSAGSRASHFRGDSSGTDGVMARTRIPLESKSNCPRRRWAGIRTSRQNLNPKASRPKLKSSSFMSSICSSRACAPLKSANITVGCPFLRTPHQPVCVSEVEAHLGQVGLSFCEGSEVAEPLPSLFAISPLVQFAELWTLGPVLQDSLARSGSPFNRLGVGFDHPS